MSKPILVVRFPNRWNVEQAHRSRKAIHGMKDLMNEYHVLVLQDAEVDKGVKFEVYNSPHEPEKIGEITELVELSINRCMRQEEEKLQKQKQIEDNE